MKWRLKTHNKFHTFLLRLSNFMYIITQKCWKTCKKKKALAYIAELHKVKLLKKTKNKKKKKEKDTRILPKNRIHAFEI